MERLLTAGLLFACFGYNVAAAKTENIYFLGGTSVTLRPPSGSASPITSVTWRHNEDLAAEWSQGEPTFEPYRNFKNRTNLNTANGYLEISKMTDDEAGTYSVEINNLRLEDRYVVERVEKPPVPNVWIKPTVDQAADRKEAVCQGDVTKAGPVTYWWDVAEDGSWVRLDERIFVQDNETTRLKKTFSCKIVSPVAEEQSKPEPNPFYPEPKGNLGALGALAIIPILILAGLGIWKRDDIKKKFCPGEATGERNGATGAANAANAVSPETHPLKSTEAAGNQS